MGKILIIVLGSVCIVLSIIAIVNTLKLQQLKEKTKRKFYHTPKLSSLHGKEFSDYINYLTSGLH